METAARPAKELDVDLIGGGGGAPVPARNKFGFTLFVFQGRAEAAGFGAEEGGLGAVDRGAIHREPLTYLVETLDFSRRDDTLGVRSDVEQIIAALAGNVDQVAQQSFGGLEIMVVGLVTPGVVHGHAGFPVAAGITLRRNVLFRCFGIAVVTAAEPIVPDQIGVLVKQSDDLAGQSWRHVRR